MARVLAFTGEIDAGLSRTAEAVEFVRGSLKDKI